MAQDHEKKETKPDEEIDDDFCMNPFVVHFIEVLTSHHLQDGFKEHVMECTLEELRELAFSMQEAFETIWDWMDELTSSDIWKALQQLINYEMRLNASVD